MRFAIPGERQRRLPTHALFGGVGGTCEILPALAALRVIAGELKGRRLVTPRGVTTRPTADQVRIALMDTLGPWLPDARLLDLFAGAGGVGFEALSRGAAHATFVERDPRALEALGENIRTLGLEARTQIVRGDVVRQLARLAGDGRRFEVVFLDPPYATDDGERALAALGAGALSAPEGLVIAQHLTKRRPPEYGVLRAFRDRRFGETTLTFFRAEG
ncbi:MAG TPA: 16S rRNA (guanine(966)-N(2))-methyltransferase RsmD [Methylomirabilota bacterium]|nr:16S rRNA (guanine(966)-N(2))-methyltransferase RsmD [Methylomirabilota bacterium]